VQYHPLAPLNDPANRQPRRPRRHASAGWSLVLAALLLAGAFTAGLQHAFGESKAGAVPQQVVAQQLQALAHENAGAAFALADPVFRHQFGTPEAFLDTVREQYPMLMHPASLLFLKPETDGAIAMQKVRITDQEGTSWSLTYLLNRQRDNQWLISGCVVRPEGRQILT
jgi:hypothetical protein